MNKQKRQELLGLAERFARTLPGKYDEYSVCLGDWDRFGDAFFDWMSSKTHSFLMDDILEKMVAFRATLSEADMGPDWNEFYARDRGVWMEMAKKFVLFCGM